MKLFVLNPLILVDISYLILLLTLIKTERERPSIRLRVRPRTRTIGNVSKCLLIFYFFLSNRINKILQPACFMVQLANRKQHNVWPVFGILDHTFSHFQNQHFFFILMTVLIIKSEKCKRIKENVKIKSQLHSLLCFCMCNDEQH